MFEKNFSRSDLYLQILGDVLFSTLNARQRGRIFFYARRRGLSGSAELAIVAKLKVGEITIDQIQKDHEHWKRDRSHWASTNKVQHQPCAS